MIRAALLLAALWAAGAQAQGVETDETAVTAIEVGIFCSEDTGERTEAPGTVSGFVDTVRNVQFKVSTTVVPVAPGFSFGYRATLDPGAFPDAGADGSATVLLTTRHPPFRGNGVTTQIRTSTVFAGGAPATLYSFDYDYEMVPGRWSFEMEREGRTLVRVTFDAVPASLAPDLVGLCSGQPMVSRAAPELEGSGPTDDRPRRVGASPPPPTPSPPAGSG